MSFYFRAPMCENCQVLMPFELLTCSDRFNTLIFCFLRGTKLLKPLISEDRIPSTHTLKPLY